MEQSGICPYMCSELGNVTFVELFVFWTWKMYHIQSCTGII